MQNVRMPRHGGEPAPPTIRAVPFDPLTTIEAQLADMRAQGVELDESGEACAREFLAQEEGYTRIRALLALFPRHTEGRNKGRLVRVFLEDLIYLERLDERLVSHFLALSLNVERAVKMSILRGCEARGEDGYTVVADFLDSMDPVFRKSLEGDLERRSDSTHSGYDEYMGGLISSHRARMPVRVLMEVISFGTKLSIYKFCAERWQDAEMRRFYYVLKQVKDARNACGHGSCLVSGFRRDARSRYRLGGEVSDALSSAGLRNNGRRREMLANQRVQQLVAVLYAQHLLGTSQGSVEAVELRTLARELRSAVARLGDPSQRPVTAYLSFILEVENALFPEACTDGERGIENVTPTSVTTGRVGMEAEPKEERSGVDAREASVV